MDALIMLNLCAVFVGFTPTSAHPAASIQTTQTLPWPHSHMVPPPRSRSLRRRSSLLHPFFRRAPQEGTAGLQNSASRDPVRERGDQVFGERTRATADSDDDFFPDVDSLSINDMGDTNTNTS